MNISDWIQVFVGIITGAGVLSSIFVSVKTLKDSSKMIEESTRPNIIIYKDVIEINSPTEYLVIRNNGNSTAHITSISFDEKRLDKLTRSYSEATKAFKYLNNSYLAPNQFYKIPIITKDSNLEEITFELQYSGDVNSYTKEIVVNLKQDYGIYSVKQHSSNQNYLKNISNATQELIKRIS